MTTSSSAKLALIGTVAALAIAGQETQAFAPTVSFAAKSHANVLTPAFMAEDSKTESAFVPIETPDETADSAETAVTDKTDISLDAVEGLGRGAAKAKRGKRKGAKAGPGAAAPSKAAAALKPEEVYYEGPPAITETIAPTISILTVVGIIPAAAAWARQAWVRYKITSRRIRVTSGINGKDMAEIVYPDIVEIRTAKRLFGDGDMVAFLTDGAKFEMRNIPNFEETMEFILGQVDKDVAAKYRKQGDVTKPEEE
mmetsp:Transcript_8219/g.23641  ORF Transcript_8219/g.23641 Transcript_8219/m.23641 type:complete len:255 (-) Transcript_8219:438-1202(-)|eukprot:CAMPEP_0119560184 /NCGR_PEP_ID=MMETSP1352-20130426/14179_1 /TAXON_ID=265584 /ORGANISM="Stauroneis constricta, Strain CCMP1120" /LENGTH=254 /DNA_ID=CAMNT_0007608109 /DNA_START=105 /DNA_END=869 /DNA_ORIENTATION=+